MRNTRVDICLGSISWEDGRLALTEHVNKSLLYKKVPLFSENGRLHLTAHFNRSHPYKKVPLFFRGRTITLNYEQKKCPCITHLHVYHNRRAHVARMLVLHVVWTSQPQPQTPPGPNQKRNAYIFATHAHHTYILPLQYITVTLFPGMSTWVLNCLLMISSENIDCPDGISIYVWISASHNHTISQNFDKSIIFIF